MKTLAYGTLPNHEEFLDAVLNSNSDTGSRYDIEFNRTDKDMMKCAGLLSEGRFETFYEAHKLVACYTAEQLYCLVQNLIELHETDSDVQYANWAGNFASLILATLGFEWI